MTPNTTNSDMLKNSDTPRVETATIEDLEVLTELVMELFELQNDFSPNRDTQENGIRLILEQPNRGRILILRNDHQIFGMANLLFTISTAMGGMVIILEDFIIHPTHRGQGYGSILIDHISQFAKQKNFLRITLLTDKISAESQNFFKKIGFSYSNMIPMKITIE